MLLYTVRYGVHGVYSSNYAVLAVRCKFQDSVFLRLTVRCDTVRYGNLLQYYNTVYTTGYTAGPRCRIGSTYFHIQITTARTEGTARAALESDFVPEVGPCKWK